MEYTFFNSKIDYMIFLKIVDDEIFISSLPHPISMFLLGFTIFAMIMLYSEYKKTKQELKECQDEIKSYSDKFFQLEKKIEERVSDVSKKIDSRVDKAIQSFKK